MNSSAGISNAHQNSAGKNESVKKCFGAERGNDKRRRDRPRRKRAWSSCGKTTVRASRIVESNVTGRVERNRVVDVEVHSRAFESLNKRMRRRIRKQSGSCSSDGDSPLKRANPVHEDSEGRRRVSSNVKKMDSGAQPVVPSEPAVDSESSAKEVVDVREPETKTEDEAVKHEGVSAEDASSSCVDENCVNVSTLSDNRSDSVESVNVSEISSEIKTSTPKYEGGARPKERFHRFEGMIPFHHMPDPMLVYGLADVPMHPLPYIPFSMDGSTGRSGHHPGLIPMNGPLYPEHWQGYPEFVSPVPILDPPIFAYPPFPIPPVLQAPVYNELSYPMPMHNPQLVFDRNGNPFRRRRCVSYPRRSRSRLEEELLFKERKNSNMDIPDLKNGKEHQGQVVDFNSRKDSDGDQKGRNFAADDFPSRNGNDSIRQHRIHQRDGLNRLTLNSSGSTSGEGRTRSSASWSPSYENDDDLDELFKLIDKVSLECPADSPGVESKSKDDSLVMPAKDAWYPVLPDNNQTKKNVWSPQTDPGRAKSIWSPIRSKKVSWTIDGRSQMRPLQRPRIRVNSSVFTYANEEYQTLNPRRRSMSLNGGFGMDGSAYYKDERPGDVRSTDQNWSPWNSFPEK